MRLKFLQKEMPHQWMAWGSNSEGQLGISPPCEWTLPQPITPIDKNANLQQFDCIHGGYTSSFATTAEGTLWQTDHRGLFMPVQPMARLKVKLVACSWTMTVAVTFDDKVYVRRGGGDGWRMLMKCTVRSISAGPFHCCWVSTDGRVFKVDAKNDAQSVKVHASSPGAKQVLCGRNFTALVFSDRISVLETGETLCEISTEDALVGCGWRHLVVAKGGTVWCWIVGRGCNSLGQLGIPGTSSREHSFGLPSGVQELAVGPEHTLLRCADGQVWVWGWNEHGSCGVEPGHSLGPRPIQVGAVVDRIGVSGAGCFVRLRVSD